MRRTIATIGYEGASLGAFIAALQAARIDTLIDVREVALSRKKGFSKTQLAETLDAHGIRYVHLRGLGDPKDGRDAARAGDYARFRKVFGAHMRTARAQEELAMAASIVGAARACLMCYEADDTHCHRRIVAAALSAATGLAVTALRVAPATERMAA